MGKKVKETWAICGRTSKEDPWEPIQEGFPSEAKAVAWLNANWRNISAQGDWNEFYLDVETNENPADLYARTDGERLWYENADGSVSQFWATQTA